MWKCGGCSSAKNKIISHRKYWQIDRTDSKETEHESWQKSREDNAPNKKKMLLGNFINGHGHSVSSTLLYSVSGLNNLSFHYSLSKNIVAHGDGEKAEFETQ